MSIAVTERARTISNAFELGLKLATGLLIVSAAFMVLLAIHVAVVTPEATLQMFLQ
jgi:hypothetical protein